jgi:hypothetical protein
MQAEVAEKIDELITPIPIAKQIVDAEYSVSNSHQNNS